MVKEYSKIFLASFFTFLSKSTMTAKIRSYGGPIASTYDLCAVILAWIFSYLVLLDTITDSALNIPYKVNFISPLSAHYAITILSNLIWILPAQVLLFRYYGLYRGFWRFASIQDLRKILHVAILGGLTAWVILRANLIALLPWTSNIDLALIFPPRYVITLLYSIFLIVLLSSARLFVRFIKDYKHLYGDYQRVIIVGAGNAGEGLVRDLLRDDNHRYTPIAFVDDDPHKLGREIRGIRVSGNILDLPYLIKTYAVDLVLIAIPSASSPRMRTVVEMCEKAKTPCYTLPGIKDLASGHVSINKLRSISLEDLIGRYPVTCQWSALSAHLKNKTIVVTGGGGSIGSELCRQIAQLGECSHLVIIDNNEYNLYAIDMELRERFPDCPTHPILLSITERIGIKALFKKYQPHLVFHAAAYKHVPLLEYQPRIAIDNNIIGTAMLAEESALVGVEAFILISTDKAVNPTNIMGATKRAAEYFCQNLNEQHAQTRFITVRFGNVLDSAGSVVPLFRKQIEAGGPVTVTHAEITRFFMTIPEATQLIMQAAFLGQGGEIFVLDMGEPIKIRYLAEQMIKLAGKTVEQDIKIIYTGLRPGEKLYEECFYSDETLQSTVHSKILRAQSQRHHFLEMQDACNQIRLLYDNAETQDEDFVRLLKKLVPEYQDNQDRDKGNVAYVVSDSDSNQALRRAQGHQA